MQVGNLFLNYLSFLLQNFRYLFCFIFCLGTFFIHFIEFDQSIFGLKYFLLSFKKICLAKDNHRKRSILFELDCVLMRVLGIKNMFINRNGT